MSLLNIEAAAVGVKEALKLGAVWLVFASVIAEGDRRGLLKYFYGGIALTSLLFITSFFISPDIDAKAFLSKLTGYVFFIFFMAATAVLFRGAGGAPSSRLRGDKALGGIVAALTVVYFSPDIIGSSMFIRELSLMRESSLPVYLSACLGFAPLAVMYLTLKGQWPRVGRFFGPGQFLLFLALVKLLAGGTRGFGGLSLLPAVQRGVMKFVHDIVHQTFVLLMVPDHPLLKTTVWNFIGIFFGPNFGMFIALLLLLLPPAAVLYVNFTSPIPVPEEMETGAERRMHRAGVRADRLRKAAPVAVFILVVMVSWFSGRGEQAATLYIPKPKPVVEDKGRVIIPLTDPTMDLMDGSLHKFSLLRGGETINLMVIKNTDGRLAVCLDACEICPPKGYGLAGGNVTCIYCMTPIPVETLGRAGGCNPIPLEAEISGRDIRIDVDEIDAKWRIVTSGKGEGGR